MINKKRLIIILAVLAGLLAVFFTSERLWNFFNNSAVQELSFQKGISYRLENYNKDILFINNEEIKSISPAGDEIWSSVTGLSNPGVCVSGDYVLIYDLKGTTALLFRNNKLVKKVSVENSILSANINKKGYFAIATDEVGYKGMVTVYSPSFKEIYRWHSGSGYIADLDISPENHLAVSQINTDGEQLISRVLLFNIKNNKEKECLKRENILVSDIKFYDNESFTALSDTDMFGFTSGGNLKYNVNFGGRSLIYYNIENMHNLVLAFKGNVNNTILESYSNTGKLRGSFDAPGEIGSADVNGEVILITSQRSLYSILPSGKLKFKREMKNEISSVKIYSSRRKAVLIGGNNVLLYDIH